MGRRVLIELSDEDYRWILADAYDCDDVADVIEEGFVQYIDPDDDRLAIA